MPEGDYTNREIDHINKDIISRLDRIEQQTIKTNGRVSALERWMFICLGGGSVVTALVLPLIVQFLKNTL